MCVIRMARFSTAILNQDDLSPPVSCALALLSRGNLQYLSTLCIVHCLVSRSNYRARARAMVLQLPVYLSQEDSRSLCFLQADQQSSFADMSPLQLSWRSWEHRTAI